MSSSSLAIRPVAAGDGARPVVAVLMCVHAGADPAHFAAALASLQQQSYSALRLFVYVDGPVGVAHEAVLSRLRPGSGGDRLLRGERPAGLPTGLNALIDAALDDPSVALLARMDADDIAVPERIEHQVRFLAERPEVDAAGSWCIEFSEDDVPLFHKRLPLDHAALTRFMLYRSPFNHPTVMVRRAVFASGLRYDARLRVMQDYDLWARMVIAGYTLGNVPAYLLWFRVEQDFYKRRAGLGRALREIAMRRDYARATGLLRLANYPRYAGLVAVRVAPVFLKKLSYKYLRTA
jgi:hypothetical protein